MRSHEVFEVFGRILLDVSRHVERRQLLGRIAGKTHEQWPDGMREVFLIITVPATNFKVNQFSRLFVLRN